MLNIPHPSAFLPSDILSEIRNHATAAERYGDLHQRQLSIIHDQRWFKMFVPTAVGGLEMTLPDALKIEEGLAWADGSTAWVVTLCSGAGWFYGFLPPAFADRVFRDDKVCIAGSGAATGTAEQTGDEFLINGTWKYATGALHATMITANCVITRNGMPLHNNDGTPAVRSFIVHRNDVTLEKNWNAMGMIATGSHGFSIRNLRAGNQHVFQINPGNTTNESIVYKYPFLQFAEVTLAVNYAGMAQMFLDLCEPLFEKRMRENKITIDLPVLLQDARDSLQNSRNRFYNEVTLSWNATHQTGSHKDQYDKVSILSHKLYHVCHTLVNSLYPYTGMNGANSTTELNRVWRNFHTASQHTLFSLR